MKVFINDEQREFAAGASVHDALGGIVGAAAGGGIAAALNGVVVPRETWATTPLKDGDNVLVIRAAQGG